MKGKIKAAFEKTRKKLSEVAKRVKPSDSSNNDATDSKLASSSKKESSASKSKKSEFDDDPIALLPLIGDIYIESRILYRLVVSVYQCVYQCVSMCGVGRCDRGEARREWWSRRPSRSLNRGLTW